MIGVSEAIRMGDRGSLSITERDAADRYFPILGGALSVETSNVSQADHITKKRTLYSKFKPISQKGVVSRNRRTVKATIRPSHVSLRSRCQRNFRRFRLITP